MSIIELSLLFFILSINFFLIPFSLGVENLSPLLINKIVFYSNGPCRAGLITNQTGVDQKGKRTVEVLGSCGCSVKYVFVPEHGMSGVAAERDVHDSVDEITRIPIVSLYGNGTGKMISADHMNGIDLLVFDIQDSGMRHYTYISTLLNTMKIAAEYKKPYVVLDRPNPLGGLMQGPLVDDNLLSFISIASIPVRHGMTIGELAWYFNTHVLNKPALLHVVTMRGYNRVAHYPLAFLHQLSPNLQSLQSCYGYSFLGLLGEIEPFDVGVGTPLAFRCILLPKAVHSSSKMWKKLQNLLLSYGVKSYRYYHVNSKTKKKNSGLRLEFSDIVKVRSFELLIEIVLFFKQENIALSFSAAFDKAVGTKKVKAVVEGVIPKDLFFAEINSSLDAFWQQAYTSFFYEPFPII